MSFMETVMPILKIGRRVDKDAGIFEIKKFMRLEGWVRTVMGKFVT